MKPSEYGGSDTVTTNGIQPSPHEPTAQQGLRMLYQTDPSDALSAPDRSAAPVQTRIRARAKERATLEANRREYRNGPVAGKLLGWGV